MQEIADYSLMYPQLLALYYRYTGDAAALLPYYETALGMIRHFAQYERADGLLMQVADKWNLVDWPENLRDDYETYFLNEAGTNKLVIKIKWIERKKLHYLVLKEAIPLSQRVEAFNVCYEENGSIKKCYEGTTIGYKRIVDLKGIHTDSLAIVIEDSRVAPAMAFVGVY